MTQAAEHANRQIDRWQPITDLQPSEAIALGFDPIPLRAQGDRKAPRPDEWQLPTTHFAPASWKRGESVGLRTGLQRDGTHLYVADFDHKPEQDIDAPALFAAAIARIPEPIRTKLVLASSTSTRGRYIAFRACREIPSKALRDDRGLKIGDFLGPKRQVVAPTRERMIQGSLDSIPLLSDDELDAVLLALLVDQQQTEHHDTCPQAAHEPPKSGADRDAIETIKQRFDLLVYARQHWPGKTRTERNRETRILGHGGLLINTDKGIWNCRQEEIGGDCIDLVGYRLYEDRWNRTDGVMFRAALEEAARETGVALPAPAGSSGDKTPDGRVFTVAGVAPVAGDDDTVTLKRSDYERLRARAEAADRLEAWRAWSWAVASISNKQLSPAAKVVAFTLWPEMEARKEHGVVEPQRVFIEEECKKAGLSADTYGTKLVELEKVRALDRIQGRQANGHKKTLVAPANFADPESWAPPEERNHGGQRPGAGRPAPACAECGPEAPIKERRNTESTYWCAGCGLSTPLAHPTTRTSYRFLQYDAQSRAWKPTATLDRQAEHAPGEANRQLDAIGEDSSAPPMGQNAGWLEGPTDEANNQVAGWPAASRPAPADSRDYRQPVGAPVPPVIEEAPTLTTAIRIADGMTDQLNLADAARLSWKTALTWLQKAQGDKALALLARIDHPEARAIVAHLAERASTAVGAP